VTGEASAVQIALHANEFLLVKLSEEPRLQGGASKNQMLRKASTARQKAYSSNWTSSPVGTARIPPRLQGGASFAFSCKAIVETVH
jgi:hypothetical protein